jgi:FlaA1/EpsC-like NDP-sugar epimerase
MKTNVLGTQNVIDLAIDHHIEKMVAISTDKAVGPNTFMGITKLMMERMVISAPNYSGHPEIKFAAVRFGNVINSRGSVIPTWIEQIKRGGPVLVTDKNMERYFMSISEAVNLVFSAVSKMLGNEIFVLKMPKYKIYDLAQALIKRYSNGKLIKIKIIGVREREKLDEKLFTSEEEELMVDGGSFNIILPDKPTFLKRLKKYKNDKKSKQAKTQDLFSFLSEPELFSKFI